MRLIRDADDMITTLNELQTDLPAVAVNYPERIPVLYPFMVDARRVGVGEAWEHWQLTFFTAAHAEQLLGCPASNTE